MTTPIAYGIDFGTTNSAIAIAYEDGAVLVPHGPARDDVVSSVVYMDSGRQRLIGDEAVRQYLVNPDPALARLLWSVKYFLADDIWQGTESPSGGFLEPSDIVAIVLRELKVRADKECGHDIRRVVLGHPVMFAGADGPHAKRLNELAKSRLEEAGFKAGFESVALFEESQAALAGEERIPGVIVSLDFGGGTFDVSIIQTDDTGSRFLLASQGIAIGGDLVSEVLFDHLLAAELGYYTQLPPRYRGRAADRLPMFRTLPGAVTIAGDSETRRLLHHFIDYSEDFPRLSILAEVVLGGQSFPLHRSIDEVKVRLSTELQVVFEFLRPGITLRAHAERVVLETMIYDYIAQIDMTIERALSDAGLSEGDVDLIVRTGGSSQLPIFVERVNARFGARRVQERDVFTTVALGLALAALEVEW